MLSSVFYKSLFKQAAKAKDSDTLTSLLTNAKDVWLPKTLNCLKDDSTYILDIMESLATSLSLLIFLFFLEKNNSESASKVLYNRVFVDKLNSTYFEPMV